MTEKNSQELRLMLDEQKINQDLLFLDPWQLDSAIIGTPDFLGETHVVYSYARLVQAYEETMKDDDLYANDEERHESALMSVDDAQRTISYLASKELAHPIIMDLEESVELFKQ